jgi:tetratricopeptide (TPR) repeat protein/TolB-like protein/predicted Ser/Thr protein kinase
MNCPACGRDNLPGASRCAKCGRLLPEAGGSLASPASPAPGVSSVAGASPAPASSIDSGGATSALGGFVAGTAGSFAPGARLAPGTFIGQRYQIEAVLGEGGMGLVYRAHDRELNRKVALKVIRPELASHPEILDRFKREVLLASKVTHRNVVRLHDLGEAGDLRFLSMSYIDGESLKALLEREGPLSPERGVPIVRGVAEALQAAHEAGVVHRDLKPHNVLIDKEGQPYVGDFGISRSMTGDATMTETGAILGTVDYMSPEQARGDVPDQRSDIYSLGVMMFEMFTGTLPFRAANPLSVMVKRVHEDVPSPSQVRPGLPPWLNAVMLRALARDPKVRYQSVAELIRDLDRQRATRAKRRLIGRRALAVAATVVVAVGLLAGTKRLLQSRSAGAPAVKSSLALLPFRNQTADPRYDWVPAGVTSVLRTGLVQARALRLADDARTQEILDILKPAPGEEARPDTAQRLGRLAGVDHVLAGALMKIGNQLRLQATLIPIGGAGTVEGRTLTVDGRGDEALLGMMDQLVRDVRQALGVSRAWGETEALTAQLSTKSVSALSAYGEGLALSRAGNQIEAAHRLEAATKEDPGFAMAHALLAETYDALGRSDDGKASAERAVSLLSEASPWEAGRVRAVRARLAGDPKSATRELEAIVAAAPNDSQSIFDLAQAQEDGGQMEAALHSLERLVALDPKNPAAQFALGRVLTRSGNPGEGVQALNRALALYQESGSDEGRARVLNGLGNIHLDAGQYDDAERQFKQAYDLRQSIGDAHGALVSQSNLALTVARRGRIDEAVHLQKEAIAAAAAGGDRSALAKGQLNLGDILQSAGRPDEALQVYQDSLKTLREAGDQDRLAQVLGSLGYLNSVLGKYNEAYFFLKDALDKSRALGDKANLVRALGDIGGLEQVEGRYEEALASFDEGIRLARQVENKGGLTQLTLNVAQVHADQGDYGAALQLLAGAEKTAREAHLDATLTNTLAYSGDVAGRAGDADSAQKRLAEAIRLAREQRNDAILAEALIYDADRLVRAGQTAQAGPVLREAAAFAAKVGDFRLERMARLSRGTADGSRADLEAVLKDARAAGLEPLVAPALVALGRLDAAAGRADDAARRASEAADAARRLGQRDWLFQAWHLTGQVESRRGKSDAAADAYRRALPVLEEMRSGLSGEPLHAFLARPGLVQFGRDADAVFRSDKTTQDRLATLLKP